EVAPVSKVDPAQARFFEQKVRPLLVEKCQECHGAAKQKGGLRLDSLDAVLKGGETGEAVVPGKPEESLLIEAISYKGPEMPPAGKLEPTEIDTLTRWVALGMPWPDLPKARDGQTLPIARVAPPVPEGSKSSRAFWSFQPVRASADAERSGAIP